jgi:hypothetical protein
MSKNINQKHQKYKTMYGQNEIFWGLGIEEETYFQFSKPIHVATSIIRNNHKPERYSVDYYKQSFKPDYKNYFNEVFPDSRGFIPMPLFLNCHALQRMDVQGNHQTTYEKVPKLNPKFGGKTLFEELQEYDPSLFRDQFGKNFVFDGDTIEFMTLNFYKTSASSTVRELTDYKQYFLGQINRFLEAKRYFLEKGSLIYPPVNPGWAVFCTNPQNIMMFNNGTYHINITLPSLLGSKVGDEPAPLLYPELFKQQHKKAILMYQWVEPFLIATYGTSDPFSDTFPNFSKGSQRCAMSRYIGIGTYDTKKMAEGKILTLPIEQIEAAQYPFWWYTRYHTTSAYKSLDKIGLDINYRKHYNHGIELRFFDWFDEKQLKDLIKFLVCLADCALDKSEADEPIVSQTWNDLTLGVIEQGSAFILTDAMMATYEKLLGFRLSDIPQDAGTVYNMIVNYITTKYKKSPCAKAML